VADAVKFFINDIGLGAAGNAADSLDTRNYALYTKAGVSDFYLRNFPQFNRVIIGTNDGRSYYDSFQLSLRRQAGSLKIAANYTFSKSIDNISVDGSTFTSPIDNSTCDSTAPAPTLTHRTLSARALPLYCPSGKSDVFARNIHAGQTRS